MREGRFMEAHQMSKIDPSTERGDKSYRLTPLGLLGQQLYDKVLVLMVKFGDNAIVLNNGALEWAKVEGTEPPKP